MTSSYLLTECRQWRRLHMLGTEVHRDRYILNRLMSLNIWSRAGSAVWKTVVPLGSGVSLGEVSHWE